MAYKSYKIKVNPGANEELVYVNLTQGIDTLKILSLELNSEDTYQLHTSNFGVIVGRVLANNSYGVPNVKVSVFISLDNDDSNDSTISSLYPYSTMMVKNDDGKRYNILPNSSFNGYDGNYKPIGSFPNKRMVLDNDAEIEVFDKYWKYTTITNEYGDYMIFGVPTGSTQVHINCDISDIGLLSQRPYDMINKGYDSSLFKSMTEFKTDNLDSAPQIFTQNKTVTVFPFWGDSDENRIGITRCDIDLNYEFTPCCVFMGSCITDSTGSYFGVNGIPNGSCGRFDSLNTSTGNIEIIRQTENGTIEAITENVNDIIDGNGVWCYQIPMNLDRIGMDEEGNIIPINTPGQGIPTRARVRMRISLTSTDSSYNSQYAAKMLVPCNPPIKGNNTHPRLDFSDGFTEEDWENYFEFGSKTPDCCFRDLYWNKVYSVKAFYPRIQNGPTDPYQTHVGDNKWSDAVDYSQMPIQYSKPLSCISFISDNSGKNIFPYNTMYSGAENMNDVITYYWFTKHLVETSTSTFAEKGLHFCFENDWVNGCLYFPHILIKYTKDGNLDYFGRKNDEGNGETYDHIYITGRHELLYSGGKYKTHRDWVDRWTRSAKKNMCGKNNTTIDKTSRFSQVKLPIGIIKKISNKIGENIYYYRCGGTSGNKYYRLYSNDIILLGNLVDIIDTLPQLYKKVPSTTALFPPLAPPKELDESGMNMNGYRDQLSIMFSDDSDSERVDIYNNKYQTPNGTDLSNISKYQEYGEYSNALWEDAKKSCPDTENGEIMFYAQERLALYFAYRVGHVYDYLQYYPSSFVNMSRICELDVQNDHAIKGSLLYQDFLFPINGIIDRFDISNNDTRSEFASLNYDINKYTIDSQTKQRKFVPTPLYLVDFDGRLGNYTKRRNFNFIDEEKDESYILFRYGDTGNGPMKYSKTLTKDSWNLNEDLIVPENSFYFYFGLNSGFSAIDSIYKKYCANTDTAVSSDDALDVNIYNSTICSISGNTSNVDIVAAHTLVPPFAYYLYQNDELVLKGVNSTETISISGLSNAMYEIEVNDCQNHTSIASFEVKTENLNASYIISNENDYAIILNSIESSDIDTSNYNTNITSDTFLVKTLDGNEYILTTDSVCTAIKGETNLNMFGAEYVNHYLSFAFGAKKNVTFTITDKNNTCHSTKFSITTEAKKLVNALLNDVPISVLTSWPNLGFNYKEPLTIGTTSNCNYSPDSLKDYTQLQQLQFISNMLSALWGGDDMVLSHTGGSDKVKDVCVSPLDTSNFDTEESETFATNYLYQYQAMSQYASVDGYCNNNNELPHLISFNYPITLLNSSFPWKKSYEEVYPSKITNHGYVDNENILTTNLNAITKLWGIFWGKKYYSNFVSKVLCNANYFGISYGDGQTSPTEWATTCPTLRDAQHSFLYGFKKDELAGFFKFQTVDRRLDYQFAINTPIILPSGYNSFTNLTNKTILKGSFDIQVYGGILLKYEGSDIDSLSQKEFDWDEKYNRLVNNMSQNDKTRFYSQYAIYEDGIYSGTSDVKYNSINGSTYELTNQQYLDRQPTCEFKGQSLLVGNDKLSLQVTDCSPDISDGKIHLGQSINIDISYKPGLRPYSTFSLGSGSYNIMYQKSSTSNVYLARFKGDDVTSKIELNPDFSGHTQTFEFKIKIHSDDEFIGDTCSEMFVDGNTSKGSSAFASWLTQYDNILANDTDLDVDLLVRRVDDSFSKLKKCYSCKVVSIDTSTMEQLNISVTNGYFPMYVVNNHKAICYDGDANQYIVLGMRDEPNDVFDAYDSLIISGKKLYQETDHKTLLRQGFVHNQGYAYYASQITVNVDKSNKVVTLDLYSPLKDSEGNVDYSHETLSSGGKWHTVGEISQYTCMNHTVTYDSSKLRFTINLNGNEVSGSVLPFYFQIVNGLTYAVNIEL